MQEAFQFNFFQPPVNQEDIVTRQQLGASDALAAAEVSREAIQVLLRWLFAPTDTWLLLQYLSVVQLLTTSMCSRLVNNNNPKCSWTTV
jgi:hypothetical protein